MIIYYIILGRGIHLSPLQSHCAFESTARAHCKATVHSKSLLEPRSEAIARSKAEFEATVRNNYSTSLGSVALHFVPHHCASLGSAHGM